MKQTDKTPGFIIGEIETPAGAVPVVSARLRPQDRLQNCLARWGYRRMRYTVAPGLYAVGAPHPDSPVLVSANYKLSFDSLRVRLSGIDAWLLVVDTKGINVWCSAGKGTFSAGEIALRLTMSGLSKIVRHRRLILPQLSAPGVAAHEVTRLTKYQVIYGPVRAADIPEFLRRGNVADPAMRKVAFGFRDRLVLTPIELVHTWKVALPILAVLWVQRLLSGKSANWDIGTAFLPYIGAILAGAVLVPALLPWIPGRSFAFKGWLLGFVAALIYTQVFRFGPIGTASQLAILPAISAFLALFFTGSSTFTSLSGVRKEMRIAVPVLSILILAGIVISFVA
jgi:hypothetical protein